MEYARTAATIAGDQKPECASCWLCRRAIPLESKGQERGIGRAATAAANGATKSDWGPERIARAWAVLMERLARFSLVDGNKALHGSHSNLFRVCCCGNHPFDRHLVGNEELMSRTAFHCFFTEKGLDRSTKTVLPRRTWFFTCRVALKVVPGDL
jgi:hypothetical protein